MGVPSPSSPEAAAPRPEADRLPISPAAGCGLAVVAGLLCAGVFFLGLRFVERGELAYAPQPYRGVRLWVLREAEGVGIGVSTTWPTGTVEGGRVCATTAVRFLLFGGSPQPLDVDYCECFERAGTGWVEAGDCSG